MGSSSCKSYAYGLLGLITPREGTQAPIKALLVSWREPADAEIQHQWTNLEPVEFHTASGVRGTIGSRPSAVIHSAQGGTLAR